MCDDAVVRFAHSEARRLSRRDAFRIAAGVASGVSAGALAASAGVGVGAATSSRVVDLTHRLTSNFPVWPGNPPFTAVPTSSVGPGNSGYATRWVGFAEHTGTHVDAPAHKMGSGITVDAIDPADLVAPLIVISIAYRARRDSRATLTTADIAAFEKRHGRIPQRSLVALHTGWQPRSGGADAAGFAQAAVDLLVQERSVVAIGTDTLSVDVRGSAAAHTSILGSGRYAVETLANLHAVPPTGMRVVVGAPRFAGGTGGPARVLALG